MTAPNSMGENTSSSKMPAAGDGFASLKDLWKAVGRLPRPEANGPTAEQDADQKQFLKTLANSKFPRFLCFHLLACISLNARKADRPKLFPLRESIYDILAANQRLPRLEDCNPEGVAQWVKRACMCEQSAEGVNKWLETGDYLLVMYSVLRTKGTPQTFEMALRALAEELVRLDIIRSRKKTSNRTSSEKAFASVAQEIVKRISAPGKPTSSFMALLGILVEINDHYRPIREDQQRLREVAQRAEASRSSIEKELSASAVTLSEAQAENRRLAESLRQAEEALNRSGDLLNMATGHQDSEKDLVVGAALARIKKECSTRLEDIRLYADQAEPDTDAIIRLAREIESFMENYQKDCQ